jgi:hypothetical protein
MIKYISTKNGRGSGCLVKTKMGHVSKRPRTTTLTNETAKLTTEINQGKRPLGRPRRRWVDNIKMDLRDIEWDGVD